MVVHEINCIVCFFKQLDTFIFIRQHIYVKGLYNNGIYLG